MKSWLSEGYDRVNAMVGQDPEFQGLLMQLQEAEKVYLEIMALLTESQREAVDNYIALCEELQYQKTIAAYQIVPHRGGSRPAPMIIEYVL